MKVKKIINKTTSLVSNEGIIIDIDFNFSLIRKIQLPIIRGKIITEL